MSKVLERLTEPQNSHDADRVASYFTDDYRSDQPAHPGCAFSGRAQVLENWSSVSRAFRTSGPDYWGLAVKGTSSGVRSTGAGTTPMVHPSRCAVIIVTIRDDRIAAGRLYVEPVEHSDNDIDAAVEQLYRPSHEER